MNEKQLARLDAAAAALLLLWAGAALAFIGLVVPAAFAQLPGSDLAWRLRGVLLKRLDLAAFIVFGLALLVVYGSRWLLEFKEEGIGPLRLWSAGALAALLMCFASVAITGPRMQEVLAHGSVASLDADHPERGAFERARRVSNQMLFLRVLAALGLAVGTLALPRRDQNTTPA